MTRSLKILLEEISQSSSNTERAASAFGELWEKLHKKLVNSARLARLNFQIKDIKEVAKDIVSETLEEIYRDPQTFYLDEKISDTDSISDEDFEETFIKWTRRRIWSNFRIWERKHYGRNKKVLTYSNNEFEANDWNYSKEDTEAIFLALLDDPVMLNDLMGEIEKLSKMEKAILDTAVRNLGRNTPTRELNLLYDIWIAESGNKNASRKTVLADVRQAEKRLLEKLREFIKLDNYLQMHYNA